MKPHPASVEKALEADLQGLREGRIHESGERSHNRYGDAAIFMSTVKCPDCKGTGQLTITVVENGKSQEEQIGCIYCNGTKRITRERLRQREEEAKLWCRCEEPEESQFVGESSVCTKHHYTCSKCHGILQVG